MNNKEKKDLRFLKMAATIVLFAVFLMGFTCLLLGYNNERNAESTGKVLLNQLCNVMEKNRRNEENLLASLKDEYIIRARTVAYMLEYCPEAEYSVEKLCEMADLMSIDEIHLFDETGRIYSGSIPKYYGYSFSSGEQMEYFRPMLSDKSLSMCQDVEPNTAEGREMMYAITWDKEGRRMIQVGIEPVRLLAELDSNEISHVVQDMPVYENVDLFVADAEDGTVKGSTAALGELSLQSIGVRPSEMEENRIYHIRAVVDGKKSICSVMKYDKFVAGVVQEIAGIHKSSVLPLLMIAVCLTIACAALLTVGRNLLVMRRDKLEQLMILTSMSEIYFSMHLIDLEKNTFTEYSATERVREIIRQSGSSDPSACMKAVIDTAVSEEYLQRSLAFSDLRTLRERMDDRKVIFMDLVGKTVGWVRVSFIAISRDSQRRVNKVICASQIIDEEKRKEEALIMESHTDQLTGCSNRRAFEHDLLGRPAVPEREDFVLVSMDVNGLKAVNDTLGHGAGDELLLGAAACMKRCFGSCGRVYRMGGDEFVAIIFASEQRLDEIRREFEEAVKSWSGTAVSSLSVSCGYAGRKEFPELTVSELAKIADKRMYLDKAQYYRQEGRDRRKSRFEN